MLHYECSAHHKTNADIIKLLIKYGVDINSKDQFGQTSLILE